MKIRQALTTAFIAAALLTVVGTSIAAASVWRVVARTSSASTGVGIAHIGLTRVRRPAALAIRLRAPAGLRLDISWIAFCPARRSGRFYWTSAGRPLFRVLLRRLGRPARCEVG